MSEFLTKEGVQLYTIFEDGNLAKEGEKLGISFAAWES